MSKKKPGKDKVKDTDCKHNDDDLWNAVKSGVKPIEREEHSPAILTRNAVFVKNTGKEASGKTTLKISEEQTTDTTGQDFRTEIKQPLSTEIDRNTLKRLQRGQIPVEAKLDLHGMTRDQAHAALLEFIASSHASRMRCVMVITGKGSTGTLNGPDRDMFHTRGVLRAKVPQWLSDPAFRPWILQAVPAKPRHGGEGALYVLLRRRRQ